MKHTISVLVENHAGVLARVAGLFARRGFNIDSLAVGVTDDERVSRITIVADGSAYTLEQIEKQLNKLIDVIKVKTLHSDSAVTRELVLIKVSCTPKQRPEIISIADIAKGKISDISTNSMISSFPTRSRISTHTRSCCVPTASRKWSAPAPSPCRRAKPP